MSNNIHDTKVDKIKNEVSNIINDITNGEKDIEKLETKYNYLYSTSKTLFNFICKQVKKPEFNKEQFNTNLEQMLNHILKIQREEISQNDASENIGKLLAKQFIPQYK